MVLMLVGILFMLKVSGQGAFLIVLLLEFFDLDILEDVLLRGNLDIKCQNI